MTCIDLPLATPCLSLCLSFTKVVAGDTVVAAAGGATDAVVAAASGTTDTVVAAAGGSTDTVVAAGGATDTAGAASGGSTEEDKGGQKCTDNDNEYSNKILHYIFMQISPFRC